MALQPAGRKERGLVRPTVIDLVDFKVQHPSLWGPRNRSY